MSDVIICEDVIRRNPAKDILPRTSVYGVCVKDDEVLLIKDLKAEHWEFPGGGIEEGEVDFH